MTPSANWLYWALLSAAFAALTAIFAKVGLQGVNPDLATWIRIIVIFVVLTAFVCLTGQWTNPLALSRKTWAFLILSGLATGASWLCYFRALQAGDVSKVAPIDKFSLILAVIFAVLFLGERPTSRDWTGILLVSAGVLVLALKR